MRAIRILLLLVLASAIAGVVVSDASALGFEDNPCPPIDPDNPQLKVCPDAEVGKPYSLQVLGNGGCTPDSVTYDVTSGSAPPGVSVSSSALISGTPTQGGRYKFYISVHDIPAEEGGASWCTDDTESSREFAINVVQGLQIVQRQNTLTPAQVSAPYSLQFTATGGTPTWSVSSGALPAGLTLDRSSGLLSGTPTTAGEYPFKITAISGSHSDTQTYQLTVVEALRVANPAAPGAEVGFSFRLSLNATGGRAPYKWSATGLPAGLTLYPFSGEISGTPTAPASALAKVTVTDALGLTSTADVNLSVAARLAITKGALVPAKVGVLYSARLVRSGGVAPFKWSVVVGTKLPLGLRLNAKTGRLYGVARRAGTYRFLVEVTDALGARSAVRLVVKVTGKGARR
jgi:hypothetical protein